MNVCNQIRKFTNLYNCDNLKGVIFADIIVYCISFFASSSCIIKITTEYVVYNKKGQFCYKNQLTCCHIHLLYYQLYFCLMVNCSWIKCLICRYYHVWYHHYHITRKWIRHMWHNILFPTLELNSQKSSLKSPSNSVCNSR